MKTSWEVREAGGIRKTCEESCIFCARVALKALQIAQICSDALYALPPHEDLNVSHLTENKGGKQPRFVNADHYPLCPACQ